MTWTVAASGTKTLTGSSTEDTVDTEVGALTYVFAFDMINMALGDVITAKVYDRVDGSNYRVAWESTWSNLQTCPAKETPPLAITSACKLTLTQSSGTGRAVPWVTRSI